MLVPALPPTDSLSPASRGRTSVFKAEVSLARHVLRHRCLRCSQETVLRGQCGPRERKLLQPPAGRYSWGLVFAIQVLGPG